MNQAYLIPPSYDEKIEARHRVRVISKVIDIPFTSSLLKQYNRGGTQTPIVGKSEQLGTFDR